MSALASSASASISKKRALTDFFSPNSQKKARTSPAPESGVLPTDHPTSFHKTFPFPVPHLPGHISEKLSEAPFEECRTINDQPDLDLLFFQPFVPKSIEKDLFHFLRSQLFFYRVQYKIKRGGIETQINTPRYTTVFGLDATSKFALDGSITEATTSNPIASTKYPTCNPRPLPQCLDELRKITEIFTASTYNFCLVNYYADGADSISYHSDDERFLGPEPAIASFSLGAKRDFLMKHKPVPPSEKDPVAVDAITNAKPLKLPLASGDMVLMRGRTQANWLHSIPKRKGGESEKGRINITFRKAMVKGGTENYYQYNVGKGEVWRWDEVKKGMRPWQPGEKG
ncbi:MAG: hypothetical protein L6R40_006020 [Gallowayella cf. fulva]|nr:MAG: hypothetical protein L6R40_006020 [Xanthomendoza cf. fulva]